MSDARCGWRVLMGGAVLSLGLSMASPGLAAEPVDVELVLAVDVSLSMSPMELEHTARRLCRGLSAEPDLQAIAGRHGRIAVTYFEWAGTTSSMTSCHGR